MKKLVPFRKEVEFNTEVAEITSISLEHTLQKVSNNYIIGDLVLTGEYKIVDVSVNTEKFAFNLPFDINIDNHYDTSNLVIDIDDFYYELNDSKMLVNITVLLDNLEEKEVLKEEVRDSSKEDEKFTEVVDENVLKVETPKETKEASEIDIFEVSKGIEAYRTYKVYIVRENDTLEQILEQFNVTREELELYNDLSSITVGLKLIIPTNNNEKI